jgi:cytochrome c peroxidase
MPLADVAHNAWFFWDGRKDSLWSQALGPLESAAEHGIDRTRVMHLVREHHLASYEAVFGPMPATGPLPQRAGPQSDAAGRAAWSALPESDRVAINTVFANVGKAIAAYERQIRFGPSRFDRYVEAVLHGREPGADARLTADERAGLKLFIGRAQCTQCHNGPLFSDSHFHNTGVPAVKDLPADAGRASAITAVLADEFNCLGRYSDAKPSQCSELRFMSKDTHQLTRAYKPPTLRNVALRPPYMHAGQYATLEEVLDHYSRAPQSPAGHSEIKPLRLSQRERRQLIAFLGTLSGPVLVAPESAPQATKLSSASGGL